MEAFTHDDNPLARDRIRLHGFCDNLLRQAIGVGVGSVPGVDSLVECSLQDWKGLGFLDTPGEPARIAKGHGTEDRVRDAEPGGTELDVFNFGGGCHDDGFGLFIYTYVLGGMASSWRR